MSETRESVRALIMDEAGSVLLSRVTPLGASDGRELWVTLGGRRKEGESLEEALVREIAEELATSRYVIGPEVWLGDEVVDWGGKITRLLEHFYLVKLPTAEYSFVGEEEEEISSTHELRWWTSKDIRASNAKFVPCELGSLLEELADGPLPLRKRVRLERPD